MRGPGDRFGILLELREIVVDQAEEFQIYQHQFHRGVAHALAESQGSSVNLVRASSDRGEGIRDSQAAVVVSVPVHANFLSGGLHDFVLHIFTRL